MNKKEAQTIQTNVQTRLSGLITQKVPKIKQYQQITV
jgi:hypothetical protein